MSRSWHSFSGELMIFNSIVHTVIFIGIYRSTVAGMVADGLFNTVHTSTEREAAWWFLLVGLFYLSVGLFLRYLRKQNVAPPAFVGGMLIGLGGVGLFLAPSFGWPFIATAGVMALLERRRAAVSERPGSPR